MLIIGINLGVVALASWQCICRQNELYDKDEGEQT
jgi:hypothetical protein